MSNKAMALSQRQVQALCKGAASAGMIAEIQINGIYVRLVPKDVQPAPAFKSREQELDDELDRFKAEHGFS